MPNIKGSFGGHNWNVKGAFQNGEPDNGAHSAGTNNLCIISFDASLSNAIYGRSNTVQPPAIALIPQLRY